MYANLTIKGFFCVKLQKYKIVNAEILKYSFKFSENDWEILKSNKGASRDFMQILIPRVQLGIYSKLVQL